MMPKPTTITCEHCQGRGIKPRDISRQRPAGSVAFPTEYTCGKCMGNGVYMPQPYSVTLPELTELEREPDEEFMLSTGNPLIVPVMFPVDRWHDYLNWCAATADAVENARYTTDSVEAVRAGCIRNSPNWMTMVRTTGNNPIRFRFPATAQGRPPTPRDKMMAYDASAIKEEEFKSIQLV